MAGKKKRPWKPLRGYSFGVKDQDPALSTLVTIIKDGNYSGAEVAERGGMSAATVYKWMDGSTRYPHNRTLTAAFHAVGYHVTITPMSMAEQKALDKGVMVATAPRIIFAPVGRPATKPKPSTYKEERVSA